MPDVTRWRCQWPHWVSRPFSGQFPSVLTPTLSYFFFTTFGKYCMIPMFFSPILCLYVLLWKHPAVLCLTPGVFFFFCQHKFPQLSQLFFMKLYKTNNQSERLRIERCQFPREVFQEEYCVFLTTWGVSLWKTVYIWSGTYWKDFSSSSLKLIAWRQIIWGREPRVTDDGGVWPWVWVGIYSLVRYSTSCQRSVGRRGKTSSPRKSSSIENHWH